MKNESNLEQAIREKKQQYWNELVKEAAKSKNSKRKKTKNVQLELQKKHVEDYRDMLEKHGLFSSDNPFKFPTEEAEKSFMDEFAELGHTHIYSRLCKCRNSEQDNA